jgi:hypothetical protein
MQTGTPLRQEYIFGGPCLITAFTGIADPIYLQLQPSTAMLRRTMGDTFVT